ncbi:hypothetical protein Tco_0610591 [Tanacetum coccineum]
MSSTRLSLLGYRWLVCCMSLVVLKVELEQFSLMRSDWVLVLVKFVCIEHILKWLQRFGFFLQMGFTLILATLDGLDVGLLGDVIGGDDCDDDE